MGRGSKYKKWHIEPPIHGMLIPYRLRILFYVCYLSIYLPLLVLHMVISVENLVLCLFSLYLSTSTGLIPYRWDVHPSRRK
jgi:hypothetical protein